MLRVNRANKELVKLDKPSLTELGLTEPYDLQQMICNSPKDFFAEANETLLLIGKEVRPTDFVEDRIDILAVDQEGSLVVIELKRGSNKLQLLQALAYAGMVSKWEHDRIIAERQRFTGGSKEEVETEVEEFLLQDPSSLNDRQRINLIAEDFEYEVLVTAEWLSEVYGLDICCYRLTVSKEGDSEFLTCTCIYPPPEITEHARRRGRKGDGDDVPWADWKEALGKVSNEALVAFFRKEIDQGRENYLGHRDLYYRIKDRRIFFVGARKDKAYVWQYKRFPGDMEYWTKKIGPHLDMEPVKDGKCLRFHLSTAKDFEEFLNAVNGDLQTVKFAEEEAGDDGEGDDRA